MPETSAILRVMLADAHEVVRQGLRLLFDSEPSFSVIHDVGDAQAAVAGAKAVAPDVLVLGLSMPQGGGLAAIPEIKTAQPKTAIVVLTRFRELALVCQAMKAGALGYVLKHSPFSELKKATEAAAHGQRYLDSTLRPAFESRSQRMTGEITNREREVLRRTSLGNSNKDIAAAMNISVRTVEVHKTQGMRKLGLPDRTALMSYAVLHDWLHIA